MAAFLKLTHAGSGKVCLVEADSVRAIIPGELAAGGGCVFFKGDNAAKLLIRETPEDVYVKLSTALRA